MKFSKRIMLLGISALALVTVMTAPSAEALRLAATPPSQEKIVKGKSVTLETASNKAVDVTTEVNCSSHTLIAKVTNKTDSTITPQVSFNDQDPSFPSDSDLPIEPGKTGHYTWSYSGNNLLVDVKTEVDTFDPLITSPTLYCNEPVSFSVSDTSDSAVVGTLSNNSSFVAQTVYTRVNGGDTRVETLEPGESRLIALPFGSTIPDPQSAFVAIGTDSGYEGTYSVDLEQPISIYKQ